MDSSTVTSRRAILRRTGIVGASSVGAALLARDAEAARQERVTRRFITPRVDRFEDNYEGQWLQVTDPVDETTEVVDDCEFANWSSDETQAYDALLLDRRTGSEAAVQITAYANGTKTDLRESSVFIINDTDDCDEEFIGLDVEWVPLQAVSGKAPGPTVTETGGSGTPGPGVLGALAAVSAAVFLRALRERRK